MRPRRRSRRSGFDAAGQLAVPGELGQPVVRAAPGGRLADGMIVDASISARLLGIRLLTLNAQLTFLPAVPANSDPASAMAEMTSQAGLDEAVELCAHAARMLDRARI